MELLKIAITSMVSLVVIFILTKMMGNKQISQLSLFDYVIGITIGSIAAELATELENPMYPAVAMSVYAIAAVLISWAGIKSNKVRTFFTGKPIILLQNGRIDRKKLKNARLDVNEFLAMARLAGYFDLNQVQTAVFEQNGNVSFLPKAGYRPVNPNDMKLPVQPEELLVNVIVDGNIMEKELKLVGKDPSWLREQLRKGGYHNSKEVFLATVDKQNRVTFFKMEKDS